MDGFEYAIKKDVRNNPIVREVDEARHRQQWRWAAVAGFLVTMVLFWAWQNYVLLRHSYDDVDVSAAIKNEEQRGHKLRVELEKLRTPARMASYANDLHLVEPTGEDAIVIERVRPADLPSHSVLARR